MKIVVIGGSGRMCAGIGCGGTTAVWISGSSAMTGTGRGWTAGAVIAVSGSSGSEM